MSWSGDRWHTGSVRAASPVSRNAWQRHPPKSISRRPQLRQGSGIQSVPRKRWKSGDSAQIHASESLRTFKRGRGSTCAAGQGRASHYVSLTRLLTDGEVTVGGIRNRVTGTSWMDHEFFTNQLSEDQAGWDWFSIQLENGADLMLYRLRRKDGSIEPLSHGTYIDNKGFSRELSLSEFRMTPGRRRYNSYPIEWTIEVPTLDIALEATTPMEDQELVTTNKISPSYWEGAIRLKGKPSNGVGYLEMTGYREAVSF